MSRLALVGAAALAACAGAPPAPVDAAPPPVADPACAVASLARSTAGGFRVLSPDGTRYLVNRVDAAGIAQIHVGRSGEADACVTCAPPPGGPRGDRMKMQPRWHPSGRWILLAVERDEYSPPPILGWSRTYVEGQLQNGLWTNMWAMSPDGSEWHRLTDLGSGRPGVGEGYTGPAFTPDGRQAVFSQIVDGNVLAYYPFGRWELVLADFDESGGTPRLANLRNITPAGMHWNEPGNFHPDGESLLVSGSTEKDAQGMDLYVLNVRTGAVANLTRSPTVWDEHGVFSPDGRMVLFMSAFPYRADPGASKIFSIKTEFMLLDVAKGTLTQLTRFRTPGYPESSEGIAATPEWAPDGRSASLRTLVFPRYLDFELRFAGACGAQPGR